MASRLATRTGTPSTPAETQIAPRKFSPEIHGIRGLALAMVVAFHLFGKGRVSGGVDVFLVISAYLMTGSMIRSLKSGHLSLLHRYGRTFSRLLPAALTVIVATIVAGLVVLPRSQWEGLLKQGRAAALFLENRYLSTAGLAYGAAEGSASPFQHFWSLSIQGQFLLLWPLLTVLLLLLLGRFSDRLRLVVFAAIIGLLTLVSFLYALRLVAIDQSVAYYSLPARLWEFGLGSLAAFLGLAASRFKRAGSWAGWLGIALILSSGFVIDGAAHFPGAWTLWPVTGALLVLFSADSGGAEISGLTKTLSVKPVTWLANRGYPLYLWHWPILIFYLAKTGTGVTITAAALVLVVSLLLSDATQRWISTPFTRWLNRTQAVPRGNVTVAAVVAGLALCVAGAAQYGLVRLDRANAAEAQASAERSQEFLDRLPQSSALEGPLPKSSPEGPWAPSPQFAEQDKPTIYEEGCIQNWRDGEGSEEVLICPDLPEQSASGSHSTDSRKRVVLSGGSHAVMHYPAIRQIADEEGWELLVVDKDGCRLAVDSEDSTRTRSCQEWNEAAIPVIIGLEPDAVITLGTITSGDPDQDERYSEEQVEAWALLADADIPVITIRGTPRFSFSVPECLETEHSIEACSVERSTALADESPLDAVVLPDLVSTVDLSPAFCNDQICLPVIGDIVVYRDQGHVTATYSKATVALLRQELEVVAPQLFK